MSHHAEHYPAALPNVTGDSFTTDPSSALFKQGIESSRNSPRKRIILPIHRKQEDIVQRMLNFFQPGTYIQAHCHPRDYASETIYVIQGQLGFIEYSDTGSIQSTQLLQTGTLIDIVPRLYHSMVTLAPDTVVLEIKRGPYTDEDKTFADWSPAEDTKEAEQLLKEHEKLFPC